LRSLGDGLLAFFRDEVGAGQSCASPQSSVPGSPATHYPIIAGRRSESGYWIALRRRELRQYRIGETAGLHRDRPRREPDQPDPEAMWSHIPAPPVVKALCGIAGFVRRGLDRPDAVKTFLTQSRSLLGRSTIPSTKAEGNIAPRCAQKKSAVKCVLDVGSSRIQEAHPRLELGRTHGYWKYPTGAGLLRWIGSACHGIVIVVLARIAALD